MVEVSANELAVEPINSPEINRADAIILFELISSLLERVGFGALKRMIDVDLVEFLSNS